MSSGEISLADLPVGATAVVVCVDRGGPIGERLRDLGFWPDTEVACRRRAPLGDPRVYEVRGSQMCLRLEEARHIRVRRPAPAPDAADARG